MDKYYSLLYKIFVVLVLWGGALGTAFAQSVAIDLEEAHNCGGQIMVTINIKADSGSPDILLGTSSLFLNYDPSVLEFSKYQPKAFDRLTSERALEAKWGKHEWDVNAEFGLFNLVLVKYNRGENHYNLTTDESIEMGVLVFNVLPNAGDGQSTITINDNYTAFANINNESLQMGSAAALSVDLETSIDEPEVSDISLKAATCEEKGSITFSFSDDAEHTHLSFSLDGGQSYKEKIEDSEGQVTYDNLPAGDYDVMVKWVGEDTTCVGKDLGIVQILSEEQDAACNNEMKTVSCSDQVTIQYGVGEMLLKSTGAESYRYYIFNRAWRPVYICNSECENTIELTDLTNGTYRVLVIGDSGVICFQRIDMPAPEVTPSPDNEPQTKKCGKDLEITYGFGELDINSISGDTYFYKIHDIDNGWQRIVSCRESCAQKIPLTGLSNGRYLITSFRADGRFYCQTRVRMTNSNAAESLTRTTSSARSSNTSILEDEVEVNIFPNPASHEVFITLGSLVEQKGTLSLMNQIGQVMSQANLETLEGLHRMNTSALPNGLYYLHIRTNEQKTITKKVMIHKK